MKILLISLLLSLPASLVWNGDFNATIKQAKSTHKNVLVSFSGSDWCGPCIRLKKEILESKDFESYAGSNLLLVRADFPRQKKNQLSADQVKLNEILAEKYNPDGKFPYTVLLSENGKVLKVWDGFPGISATRFVEEIVKAGAKK